jgi:hypothetical protein
MSGTVSPDTELFLPSLPRSSSITGLTIVAYSNAGEAFGLDPMAIPGTGGGGGGSGGDGGPALSDNPPLGDASSGASGTSVLASRADHRHPFPNAAQVGAAPTSHTHAVSEIANLQTLLDAKAALVHTHTVAQISNLQTLLDSKAALAHTHAISDIADLQTTLTGKQNLSARGSPNGYAPLDENALIPPIYLPVGTGTGGGTGGASNIDNGTQTGQVAVWNNEKGRGEWKTPVPITSGRTATVERNSATTLSFSDYNRRIVCLTNVAPLTLAASEAGISPNQGMEFAVSNRHTAVNNLTFGAGITVSAKPAGTGTGGTVKIDSKGFVTVIIHPEGNGLTAIVRGDIV